MGAKLRTVRRRIRSVQSTMKITRAMELIATSRIMKAQQRVQAARPYSERLTAAIADVASLSSSTTHPLLEERPDRRMAGVFVVTSDRGLAGAYSSNVLRRAEELFSLLRSEDKEVKLFVAGRKGVSYYRFRERPVAESWVGFSETPTYDDAKRIADLLIDQFKAGDIDEIHGVFTNFVSVARQRPVARRFVPLTVEEVDRPAERPPLTDYLFEPEPDALLSALLPRYVVTRVYSALLEAAAAEHAARRRAMSAATDNAEELIKVLTRVANQARQTEITTEIMEIVGGAEALRQAAEAVAP
jgi:F-type H+-transporting ATPase subunit gamma